MRIPLMASPTSIGTVEFGFIAFRNSKRPDLECEQYEKFIHKITGSKKWYVEDGMLVKGE